MIDVKKKCVFWCFVSMSMGAFAQQDPMYTQYMFNMMVVNPAYAGSRDVLSMTALQRRMWTRVEGAPVTTMFTADMPLANEKVGIGLAAFDDRVGLTTNNGLYGAYSYRIRLKRATLALGVQAGCSQLRQNLAEAQLSNPNDPSFAKAQQLINPNFGVGAFYSTDRYYIGLSLPHVLRNESLTFGEGTPRAQYKHYFLAAGYVFHLNEIFVLKPSFLYKVLQGSPMQLDLNANLWWDNTLGFGLSYRTAESFAFLFEFQATEQVRIGYAYDYGFFRQYYKYAHGNHELMVRYELAFRNKKAVTPRYF